MIKTKSREEIAAAYDSTPWWYDIRGFFILTFDYNRTLWSQIGFFSSNMGPRHLEVACGTGTLLELILFWRRFKKLQPTQISAIDYAEPMLAGARRRFSGQDHIDICHADAAALPYATATFDTANIANAFHCFPDIQGALRDISRVLKPGGTVAANVLLYSSGSWPLKAISKRIQKWGMQKGILFTPYHPAEIRQHVINAGLELVSEKISGNCCDIVVRKPA